MKIIQLVKQHLMRFVEGFNFYLLSRDFFQVFVEFAKLQTDGSEEDQKEELLEDNLHYDPRNIALTKVSKSSNLKCGVM